MTGPTMPAPATERHQPLSLGAVILLVADSDEAAGLQVRFGEDERLDRDQCIELKRRYKGELLLADDAREDVPRTTENERSPGVERRTIPST